MTDNYGQKLTPIIKWDNNPREMWVWDNKDISPRKQKVIFIDKSCIYPVVVKIDGEGAEVYQCCADIIPEPEKKYRPYKSITELISDFCDKSNIDEQTLSFPSIWIKDKVDLQKSLIIGFKDLSVDGVEGIFVCIANEYLSFKELYKNYVFLDDTLCGMKVKDD